MKEIILAAGLLTLIAMPQFVTAAENETESLNLYAIAQIEQTLPELSDQELSKVEGQQAQVIRGGPGLIEVNANVAVDDSLNDVVDVNRNNISVQLLGGGILQVQRP
jgi:hypothetical protein